MRANMIGIITTLNSQDFLARHFLSTDETINNLCGPSKTETEIETETETEIETEIETETF